MRQPIRVLLAGQPANHKFSTIRWNWEWRTYDVSHLETLTCGVAVPTSNTSHTNSTGHKPSACHTPILLVPVFHLGFSGGGGGARATCHQEHLVIHYPPPLNKITKRTCCLGSINYICKHCQSESLWTRLYQALRNWCERTTPVYMVYICHQGVSLMCN